nr:hypothetical protein NCPCFENI_00042 [Cupriavidus sp.]
MGAMDSGVRLLDELILQALGPSAALAERKAHAAHVAAALAALGHTRLAPTILGARRGQTPRSARGWELVITVTSHAAMAKLRLLAPELLSHLQREMPDLAVVTVTAQKSIQAAERPKPPPRPRPPEQGLARLRSFYSQDH